MKYKIVEKKFIDDYSGNEKSKFYIKKKVFDLYWVYDNKNDSIDYVFKIIFSFMLALVPLLVTVPLFHMFEILNIITFSCLYLTNYYFARNLILYASKDSYYSLNEAQDQIKKVIKTKQFKNKTIDVVEITTTDNKIIFEKKN